MGQRSDYDRTDNFINRELSWMEFNRRVLAQACSPRHPLLERMRFLAITASNLDEFLMVRVAALRDQVNVGFPGRDFSGLTAGDQLSRLDVCIRDFRRRQYEVWRDSLVPALREEGIDLISPGPDLSGLSPEDLAYLDRYFEKNIFPVLTPMAIDSSRPFPLIHSGRMYIGAQIKVRGKKKKKKYDVAIVPVPDVLDRVIRLPADKNAPVTKIIFLETLIEANLGKLFLNHEILSSAPFRIMRNADLAIAEEEAPDLLLEIEKQLRKRDRGEVIILDHADRMEESLVKYLKKKLHIKNRQIYAASGPLDLTLAAAIASLKGYRHLKRRPYGPAVTPGLEAGQDLFAAIRKRDYLIHHPYEAFDPVQDLIRQAAEDPKVLAIKQTLYRVSGNSPIISWLETAAKNGKQVLVLVELKARFDEENNIAWARRLEQAGVHVIYGLVGLKIHCKMTLIVRSESEGLRRYVHLGTGNYNDKTARQYTDLGYFSCDPDLGEDATALFNMLSGYSRPARWNRLIVAPYHMKKRLLKMIRHETKNAREGKPASITGQCNALCDRDIILALYEASGAGVSIDLIVRGICCLIPGKLGLSENIRVRSLVGVWLEHARIYLFENGGQKKVFLASADLMPRNLDRRVEILFPVDKKYLQERIRHILEVEMKDRANTWYLQPDGTYIPACQIPEEPCENIEIDREDGHSTSRQEAQSTYTQEIQSAYIQDAHSILMQEALAAAYPDASEASARRPVYVRDEVRE